MGNRDNKNKNHKEELHFNEDKILDAKVLACPIPIIKIKKTMMFSLTGSKIKIFSIILYPYG
jgi:hypothetical protein